MPTTHSLLPSVSPSVNRNGLFYLPLSRPSLTLRHSFPQGPASTSLSLPVLLKSTVFGFVEGLSLFGLNFLLFHLIVNHEREKPEESTPALFLLFFLTFWYTVTCFHSYASLVSYWSSFLFLSFPDRCSWLLTRISSFGLSFSTLLFLIFKTCLIFLYFISSVSPFLSIYFIFFMS